MTRWVCCLLVVASCLAGCVNKEAKSLRERLSKDYELPDMDIPVTEYSMSWYRNNELAENRVFVDKLQTVVQNSFERQLDLFEDQELGFFRSYKYMFYRIFMSRQHHEDLWRVKSNRYFSNLEIQNDAYSALETYQERVRRLRSAFIKGYPQERDKTDILADLASLPQQRISLEGLYSHSLNNLFIEFGTEIVPWLLVLGLSAILSFLGITTRNTKLKQKLVSLVVLLLSLGLSAWAAERNDKKMIASLREQAQDISTFNYQSILDSLDYETLHFYDSHVE